MTSLPNPPESLGFLMNDALRALRRRFEGRAAELGISSAQWRLLVQLKRSGPLPQARLAELLEIEPISLSRLVDRMQEAGWLTRETAAGDRRIKIVNVTDKTRAVFSDVRCIAADIYDEALRGLPPGTHEMMSDALRRMIHNLSTQPESDDDR